jgi:hypothetical protein
MSDFFGKAMEWARFEFDFEPASVDLDMFDVNAGAWPNGIKMDTAQCRSWGMKERFANVLDNGSDFLLNKVPMFDINRDNYSSALAELEASSAMIDEQTQSGVLQYPFDDVKLINSLGVVTKKLEPGQVGKPKLRVVVDAAASGINDCMEDKPFPMPGIGDVVRSAKVDWWAAKFDLKDGFYHIPVNIKLTSLLCVKHPRTNKFAAYRFLCFGLKCAPFLFQGTMCELRRMLIHNGLFDQCAVLVYIDDWIILGSSERLVRDNMHGTL